MQAIRRCPSEIRCSTAPRAPATLSTSTLGVDGVGKRALEDDREPVPDELHERRVVGARAGDDQPVGMLGAEEGRVRGGRIVEGERLDHDPEPAGAGRCGETAQRLGEDRVAGDLLGRLAEDEGDDMAATAGELPSGRMGVVAEFLGGVEHAPARLLGDLHVRTVIQDE